MPNVTPLTILLFVQAVLLGISQLDFVTPDVSKIIIIALLVINAALAIFFQTSAGKVTAARLLIKKE